MAVAAGRLALVVEDDNNMREAVERVLEACGRWACPTTPRATAPRVTHGGRRAW